MTHAKVSLKPWQPVRVWRNRTKSEQRRTITVYPCVETFPPGSARSRCSRRRMRMGFLRRTGEWRLEREAIRWRW